MPGKKIVLTPLAERRRLLLAESDLNRELLAHEWETLSAETREATHTLRKALTVAFSVGAVASGFSLFRKIHNGQAGAKPPEKTSWLSRIIQAARAGMALWGTVGSARKQFFP